MEQEKDSCYFNSKKLCSRTCGIGTPGERTAALFQAASEMPAGLNSEDPEAYQAAMQATLESLCGRIGLFNQFINVFLD